MSKPRFVILATSGLTTNLLFESLSKLGTVEAVFIEKRESAFFKIKRRFKKLPFWNVMGQLAFLLFLMPLLRFFGKRRTAELYTNAGYSNVTPPESITHSITSVNDPQLLDRLVGLQPDFIFLNGTRIVQKKILNGMPCSLLNIHVGITPAYRGVHGGYWALFNNDRQHFGVTLHAVDAGVDTGKIIAQKCFAPSKTDNFSTYPVLQFLEGLILVKAYFSEDHVKVAAEENQPLGVSKQYYHPGFFQYLVKRWLKGVK